MILFSMLLFGCECSATQTPISQEYHNIKCYLEMWKVLKGVNFSFYFKHFHYSYEWNFIGDHAEKHQHH